MSEEMFLYKSYCELIVNSDSISADEISGEIGIVPDREHNKGDEHTSKHTGRVIKKMNNLWAVKSKVIISHEEAISGHIDYLRTTFEGKLDVLRALKFNTALEVIVWVWIETDNAGIGFQFDQEEISFFNEIANRVQFSIITNSTSALQA